MRKWWTLNNQPVGFFQRQVQLGIHTSSGSNHPCNLATWRFSEGGRREGGRRSCPNKTCPFLRDFRVKVPICSKHSPSKFPRKKQNHVEVRLGWFILWGCKISWLILFFSNCSQLPGSSGCDPNLGVSFVTFSGVKISDLHLGNQFG